MPVDTENQLVDLEEYFRELERIKAEFDAKIELLNSEIAALAAEIAEIEGQVSYWGAKVDEAEAELATWRERLTAAENIAYAIETQPDPLYYEGTRYVDNAVKANWPVWESYAVRHILTSTPRDWDRYPGPNNACIDVELPEGKSWFGEFDRYHHQGDQFMIFIAEDKVRSAEDELGLTRSQLLSAQYALESRTRHMRDLELAREAALEERRGAIALWEAEYYAARERKRIEIESIARDVGLGYPAMDAETARVIAETAYGEALTLGLTRVADALEIAMELAEDWYERQEFPHYTKQTITCPGCNSTLEITKSDIAEHNRDLTCPVCNTPVGRGVLVRVTDVWVEPPPPPPPPVVGIAGWLKANWPYLAIAGLGTGLAVTLARRK